MVGFANLGPRSQAVFRGRFAARRGRRPTVGSCAPRGRFFVGARVLWARAHGYMISPLRGCRGAQEEKSSRLKPAGINVGSVCFARAEARA